MPKAIEDIMAPAEEGDEEGIPLFSRKGIRTVAGRTERRVLKPGLKGTRKAERVLSKAGLRKRAPKRATAKPLRQTQRRGRKQTAELRQKLKSRLSQEPSLRKLDIEGSFPLVEPEMDADLALVNPFNLRERRL